MKKIFVSVGMTGRKTEDVLEDLMRVQKEVDERLKGSAEVIHNYDCVKPIGETSKTWYLGEAIKKLGDCDYCYFVRGWQNYKGCIVERQICELYGIQIIEES